MCDFGIVSGPTIAGLLTASGLTASSAAAAGAATLGGAAATAAAGSAAASGIGTTVGSLLSAAAYATAATAASQYGQKQVNDANNATASRANDQMQQLAEQERARQTGLQDQRQGIFDSAVQQGGAAAQAAEMAKQKDRLSAEYSAPATAAQNSITPGISTAANPVSTTGGRVVADAYKDKLNSVGDYLRGQGNARAGMDAFTNANLRLGETIGGKLNDLNLLNNFSAGSRSIVPLEQGAVNNAANIQFNNNQNAGNNAQSLGNILSTVGQVGGYATSGLRNGIGTGAVKASGASNAARDYASKKISQLTYS